MGLIDSVPMKYMFGVTQWYANSHMYLINGHTSIIPNSTLKEIMNNILHIKDRITSNIVGRYRENISLFDDKFGWSPVTWNYILSSTNSVWSIVFDRRMGQNKTHGSKLAKIHIIHLDSTRATHKNVGIFNCQRIIVIPPIPRYCCCQSSIRTYTCYH